MSTERPPAAATLNVLAAAFTVLTAPVDLRGQDPPPPDEAEPPDAVGVWEGALSLPGTNLPLVFEIERSESGELGGRWSSPSQGAVGRPIDAVTVREDSLVLEMRAIGGRYEARIRTDTLEGTWRQAGQAFPLVMARAEDDSARPTFSRPQTPEPPFPYAVEEVVYPNPTATGVKLAGTLTLPDGGGPHPAVVLVTGSGPQDRDESLAGHQPFRVLADHLSRSGIAVLRYDDRGVGESTGDFGSATSRDFVTDALAGVRYLLDRPEVGRVGIVGHSEGGIVAPLAAAESDQVDFIVLLAGPGLPGRDIVLLQAELIARAMGTREELIASNTRLQERVFDAISAGADKGELREIIRQGIEAQAELLTPQERSATGLSSEEGVRRFVDNQMAMLASVWFRDFLDYDPVPTLRGLDVPVLAVGGENDLQVPAEPNLAAIKEALEGRNPQSRVVELPGLNHLFQTSATGLPTEYVTIEETFAPAALELVSGWILDVTGGREPARSSGQSSTTSE